MASVMLAWEKDADVEVDVHLTKDNRIVVIHDGSTKRTAEMDLKISETSSEELRKLDVGRFKGEQFAGENIPFLEDIIETIPPNRKLYVEIKSGKKILPFLQHAISASGKMSQIVIIGFNLETMAESKRLMPAIPTYWLIASGKDEKTDKWNPYNLSEVQAVQDKGLDGMDVHYGGLTKEYADAVKASDLKLYVWTVNNPEEAIRLTKLHVNGITTDRPGWLRKKLEDYASSTR